MKVAALSPALFQALTGGRRPGAPGSRIECHDRVVSTQDLLKEQLRQRPFPPDGTLVLAREQTAGRGRMGRTWLSPRDQGLWFSLLLPPAVRVSQAMRWVNGMLAATALCRVLRSYYGLEACLKFPNDVLVKRRKLAGFLLETCGRPGRLVLGAGINLFQERRELNRALGPWCTSVALEYRRPFSPYRFLDRYLRDLESLQQECQDDAGAIVRRAREYLYLSPEQATLRAGNRQLKGWIKDISPEHGILFQSLTGEQRFVPWGSVVTVTYESPEPPFSL